MGYLRDYARKLTQKTKKMSNTDPTKNWMNPGAHEG